jgi:aminoglycoside phosphotransferase (APT) family kinase protein
LKVAKEWHAPTDRVFSEIDWLVTASDIVPVAVPVVFGIDRDTGSFVMEFLPETDFANWKMLLLQGEVDFRLAEAVGRILGQIHAKTANNPQLAEKFATDENFYALRLEPYLAEIARNHAALSDRILRILDRTASTKIALVHGDISPKNILVGKNGPVFLDAECAWYGDPAFDLAFCLNHLLLKAVHDPVQAISLLAAFCALSETYLTLVDWEASADFEARAASLLPCLMLARVDGKSPAEYLSEPERALVRKIAATLIANQPLQLCDIAINIQKESRA